jgi:hypothetical protein
MLASIIRIFQPSVQFSTAPLQLPVRSCGSCSLQPVDTGYKLFEVWWRTEVTFLHIKRPELHSAPPPPNKPSHGDRAYAKWDLLTYESLFQVHLQKMRLSLTFSIYCFVCFSCFVHAWYTVTEPANLMFLVPCISVQFNKVTNWCNFYSIYFLSNYSLNMFRARAPDDERMLLETC